MSNDRYLQRIRVCHTADLRAFEPWYVDDAVGGHVHVQRVPKLETPPSPFVRSAGRLRLSGDDFSARTHALARFTDRLVREGEVRAVLGEMYPIVAAGGVTALLALDRAVVPWFGVPAHGVHLNGFVRTPAGPAMWIARRARGKRTFPGHLDNLVAGGRSIGMSSEATLRKECHEEASLPPELAARAIAVGQLVYTQQDGLSLKVDTLDCFDLELPAEFAPRPLDGEVESFELWPLAAVAASLRGEDRWKPNCALVALHFLLRHGALDGALAAAERDQLWRALMGDAA